MKDYLSSLPTANGPYRFFAARTILEIHEGIVRRFGGLAGLRDPGILEQSVHSALQGFGGVELYPHVIEKICKTASFIIEHHPFCDGNKRTGMAVLNLLLEENGCELLLDDHAQADLAVAIAEKSISFEGLLAAVAANLNCKA